MWCNNKKFFESFIYEVSGKPVKPSMCHQGDTVCRVKNPILWCSLHGTIGATYRIRAKNIKSCCQESEHGE